MVTQLARTSRTMKAHGQRHTPGEVASRPFTAATGQRSQQGVPDTSPSRGPPVSPHTTPVAEVGNKTTPQGAVATPCTSPGRESSTRISVNPHTFHQQSAPRTTTALNVAERCSSRGRPPSTATSFQAEEGLSDGSASTGSSDSYSGERTASDYDSSEADTENNPEAPTVPGRDHEKPSADMMMLESDSEDSSFPDEDDYSTESSSYEELVADLMPFADLSNRQLPALSTHSQSSMFSRSGHQSVLDDEDSATSSEGDFDGSSSGESESSFDSCSSDGSSSDFSGSDYSALIEDVLGSRRRRGSAFSNSSAALRSSQSSIRTARRRSSAYSAASSKFSRSSSSLDIDVPELDDPVEGMRMFLNIRSELEKVGRMVISNPQGAKFLERAQILASINYLSTNVPSCVLDHLGQEIRTKLPTLSTNTDLRSSTSSNGSRRSRRASLRRTLSLRSAQSDDGITDLPYVTDFQGAIMFGKLLLC